ncbi:MAG: Histone deacetylase superfamily [Verrucomicrobiales bacterium]|nr:Histone deacetylase superfamily [Verrucomicrobiales bacterium]
MKVITDERCTAYALPGHPERPARISKTVEKLRSQKELSVTWLEPVPVEDAAILRAHTPEHLAKLKAAAADFDGDTPAYKDIFGHARRSAGAAIHAMRLARKGELAFSLIRPPGHHATRDQAMGFCFLNSIAIAALEARASGASKVAVYDFDVHHGNGTEAILVTEAQTLFASIHQSPCYPGTGRRDVGENCFNFPVSPMTSRDEYRKVLTKAMERLAKEKPDVIGVSAGFDAYARDPLAQETLEAEDFHWIGEFLRKLGIPVFSILEGGYSDDLPDLILAYLKGLEGS